MSNRNADTKSLLVDLSKPDLRTLAIVLRNRALWPPGFVWDYSHCHSCAMGLANKLWREFEYPHYDDDRRLLMPMGLSAAEGTGVFYNAEIGNRCSFNDVTPEMVANKIDAVLAAQSDRRVSMGEFLRSVGFLMITATIAFAWFATP